MHILSVHLRDFRRFADLQIIDLPVTAKLVVLAGPNGVGKSSLFDAFLLRYRLDTALGWNRDGKYYVRPGELPNSIDQISNHVAVTTDSGSRLVRGSLYVRSAYRNDHEFAASALSRQTPILETVNLARMIEPDATVNSNYIRLASQAMEDVFVNEDEKITMGEYREKQIAEIRNPLTRLFPDLIFTGIGNPLDQGAFQFNKGASKGFDYKNLSGGEKAAFDLILDIVVKRRYYADAIYCIDEPEAHMNTKVQGAILEELLDLIPDNSQLWVASHSIGMMRKARELYERDSTAVAFLDFGGRDFDQSAVLTPSKPTRAFWQDVLHVAVDDLASLVAPVHVIVCEGSPAGSASGRNFEHDAQIYSAIFSEEQPDTTFISAGNAREVQGDYFGLAAILPKIASGMRVTRLIDRDDHAPSDVAKLQEDSVRVLRVRHLEAYLYDDEVLTALCASVDRLVDAPAVLAAKKAAIADSTRRGNPHDDVKSAAGSIYVNIKKILELTQVGNDQMAFARNTLAPLIKPGMGVYAQLKRDIFGD
ncbi:AAA family ATPase [Thalassobaculum sp.]|uniref:AAA family ATPase n=1 Tax=Thalassobaculum sp. TaxID=2022740 RepID=UPI0032ED1DD3